MLAVTSRQIRAARFSEMVLYPQGQDALFYGEPRQLSDVQQKIDGGLVSGLQFRHKLVSWGIKWNSETVVDFQTHNATFC
jgi:hypothetical protein